MLEMRIAHVVRVPDDERKYHMLEIYQLTDMSSPYRFGYLGVRAQERYMDQLRPKNLEQLCSFKTPNAINSFNRVKYLLVCKVEDNKIYCDVAPNEFIELLNKV